MLKKSYLTAKQILAEAQNNDSISEIRPAAFRQSSKDKDIAPTAAAPARAKTFAGLKTSGRVLSSEDNLLVPGTNILIKGTSSGPIEDEVRIRIVFR